MLRVIRLLMAAAWFVVHQHEAMFVGRNTLNEIFGGGESCGAPWLNSSVRSIYH
jgi:hypothetical protein